MSATTVPRRGPPGEVKLFSRKEVESHNTPDDLWLIVDNKVLDVTAWAKKHPGGSDLLKAFAGNDCTDEFAAFHTPRASSYLASFQIGELSAETRASVQDLAFRKLRDDLWKRGLFAVETWYLIACVIRLLGFALTAAAFVLRGGSPFIRFVGAVCLGIFQQQSLLLAHDFLHRSFFRSRSLSFWAGWVSGSVFGGVGAAWWRRDHFLHHALTNVLDHDPSAGADPFIFIDAKQFDSKQRGALEMISLKLQPWVYFPLCIFFLWNVLFLSALGTLADGVLAWLVAHLTCSVIHLQLNVAHFPAFVWEKHHVHDKGFLHFQVLTTMNISCSFVERWFHGGLEHQIEHHLFPLLPRNKLNTVSADVKKLLTENGLPYRTQSFWQANYTCWKRLKDTTDDVLSSRRPASKKKSWSHDPLTCSTCTASWWAPCLLRWTRSTPGPQSRSSSRSACRSDA
jgi:fatty acid desaturase